MYKITTDGRGSKCIIAYEYTRDFGGKEVTLDRHIAMIYKTTGVNGEFLDWQRAATVIVDALNAAERAGVVDGDVRTAAQVAARATAPKADA